MRHFNQIISFSGGKDSTAMLLMMLELKEPIHSVVFFDTGWEFPEMLEHIDLVEKRTGVKIWHLHPRIPFEHWTTSRPIIALKGPNKGKIHRIGNGWPSPSRRWCTRQKAETIAYFCKPINNAVQCIGYASDEIRRGKPSGEVRFRLPLQEWNITEIDALRYCHEQGYHWGGLYKHFRRVSCFCCPLQGLNELRSLRNYYPDLWRQMLEMDEAISNNKGFNHYATVYDLERRFAEEDRQISLGL